MAKNREVITIYSLYKTKRVGLCYYLMQCFSNSVPRYFKFFIFLMYFLGLIELIYLKDLIMCIKINYFAFLHLTVVCIVPMLETTTSFSALIYCRPALFFSVCLFYLVAVSKIKLVSMYFLMSAFN
jgi:hypothetical protein